VPARGRKLASAQQKARCGNPARASGAISVNTRFWKILVTRVKRFLLNLAPLTERAENPADFRKRSPESRDVVISVGVRSMRVRMPRRCHR
jgi:hypothetical protein